jgi:hypothetical protein
LCVACGKPANGGVHCEIHRRKNAEWFANVRQKQQRYVCQNPLCHSEFSGYGPRRFCSRACANKSGDTAGKTEKGWKTRLAGPIKVKPSQRLRKPPHPVIGQNFSEALRQRDIAMAALPTKPTGLEDRILSLKAQGKTIGQVHEAFPNSTRDMRTQISSIFYGKPFG